MKKSGILNPGLVEALARLGHTDLICVADAGLPIPETITRIDLSIVLGVPGISEVLAALASECVFQKKVYASEADSKNPRFASATEDLFPDAKTEKISHEDFKKLVSKCRLVIRTGEASPYANVILESGVPF